MPRRLLTLLSFLLLPLFVLILWLLGPPAGVSPGTLASGPAQGSAADDAVPASQPSPASAASQPDRERSTRVAVPPAPTTEALPVPPDATWIEVRVVDKATSAPVAAADVAWMDQSTYARIRAPAEDLQGTHPDFEAIARTYGWRARSDERGIARVHLSPWTAVFARAGSRYGSLHCNRETAAPPQGYRIELAEDRALLVQVQDAAGRPAPLVPIAMARHGADGALLDLPGLLTCSRKPDGRARIPHLQQWDAGGSAGKTSPATEWRVRVQLPGLADPGVVFDPQAPPEQDVVLRLPPTGAVVARAEIGGRPVPGCRDIGLHTGALDDVGMGNRGWTQPVGPDGAARFPYLPLGVTFVAFANANGVTQLQRQFAGPAAPDQEVSVVLTAAEDDVVLAGRVLDEHQRPLPDAQLSAQYNAGISSSMLCPLQTDAQGQFVFFVGRKRGMAARLERFSIERRTQDGPTLRAILQPRELRTGVQDVGDLVLQRGPLAVAGRFVDGEQPYPRTVRYFVERKQVSGGGSPRERWEHLPGLTQSQDPDGTFEVRGELGPGQYRLSFPGVDHLPVGPLEFVPGTPDLTVQITPGAKLVATVLLPDDVPWGVEAMLKPDQPRTDPPDDDDFARSRDRLRAEPTQQEPGRQRLEWRPVTPGTYTLELRSWGLVEPLLSIPGLNLPLPAGDRRLEDIDLRGKVEVLTVRVAAAAASRGRETRGAALVFLPPLAPAARWLGYEITGGSVRIPVRPAPVDLLVVVQGFRPKDVRGARGEVDVVLEPWPEVTLLFPDVPELPEGYRLTAGVFATGPKEPGRYVIRLSAGGREGFFQAPRGDHRVQAGKVSLPIGDGPHRLSVFLCEASGRGRPLAGVTPAEILAGSAPIEVRVPADAVQKAIAEQKAGKDR